MDLSRYILKSIAAAVTEPGSVIMLVVLSIILYAKNKKISLMQKIIMGEYIHSPLELTLSQMVLGIVFGSIGSSILAYLGVAFDGNSGIWILFIISIILMLYNPRFFCFSYSASILGFVSVIIKIFYKDTMSEMPISINIVSLMTFVGIMHVLEGFLVMFDGAKGAMPVFTSKDGNVAGGFALKRYWPLPVALIIIMSGNADFSVKLTSWPGWWPLIQHGIMYTVLTTAAIQMMTLYGVIGYSSYTFKMNRKQKTRFSGICILIYGLVLTGVAQFSEINIISQIAVIIFAPAAHEFMLYIQRAIEAKKDYIYVSDEGICILDVMRDSPAEKIGIKSGDKILEINGEIVDNEKSLFATLRKGYIKMEFLIRSVNGEIKTISCDNLNGRRFGIVIVPKAVELNNIISVKKDSFQEILNKMKKENH